MGEPTIETLMEVMRDELAHLRAKAIGINLVAADLLKRGYYVYRQEMPDEMHHLLAINDGDEMVYRIRVITHRPIPGMDDVLPGEIIAVVHGDQIRYQPDLAGAMLAT
jgi:hypothetical protein